MTASSTAFEKVFVPRSRYSRWALTVWLGQNSVAAAALLVAGIAVYAKLAGLLLVLIGALYYFPCDCPRIALARNGSWALPDEGLYDLQLLRGTQFTQRWVRLRLGGATTRRRSLCIWSDAFASDDWRRLLIQLREHRSTRR